MIWIHMIHFLLIEYLRQDIISEEMQATLQLRNGITPKLGLLTRDIEML